MSPPGSVVIFGASSGIGLELVRLLAARGAPAVAVTRSGSSTALAAAGATVVAGDVLDRAAVDRVLAGAAPAAAIVSLVGGRPFRSDPPPDWDGNRNLIDAARAAGVRRFVLVSSIGAGGSRGAAGSGHDRPHLCGDRARRLSGSSRRARRTGRCAARRG